jgi:hypothetical protein
MARSGRNSGRRWTSSAKNSLRTLARKNTPTRVIALKLGRSPSAIYAKASQLRISLKPTNQSPYG